MNQAETGWPPGLFEPGFGVIETLGWDGRRFARVRAHVARLGQTCAMLGIAFDPGEVFVRLDALPQAAPARVRVVVGPDGGVSVAQAALPPAMAEWRVRVAPERLVARDPWLRVKTTRRAAYDRARAALPEGVEEMLFCNERGEMCEGSISSLFFDIGQGLCTPPLSCGLLPGILRAEMLDQGCQQAVLPLGALAEAKIWVGNSLRGMIPARLV